MMIMITSMDRFLFWVPIVESVWWKTHWWGVYGIDLDFTNKIRNEIENESLESDALESVNNVEIEASELDVYENDENDCPVITKKSEKHDIVKSLRRKNGRIKKKEKQGTLIKRKTLKRILVDSDKPDVEIVHDLRRQTRGFVKINKENFTGKLVWGQWKGWWPALIVDADHVGMIEAPKKLWVYWIGDGHISHLDEKNQIKQFSSHLDWFIETSSTPNLKLEAFEATINLICHEMDTNLTKPYHISLRDRFPQLHQLDELKFYPYPKYIQRILNQLKKKNMPVTDKHVANLKESPEEKKNVKVNKSKGSVCPVVDDTVSINLPISQQKPGVVAWAKIPGHNWWPAAIIDYRDCGIHEPKFGCQWIMWYGDYQLSEVRYEEIYKFDKGFNKMMNYIERVKNETYISGVLDAAKDYCSFLGYDTMKWDIPDVFKWFSKLDPSKECALSSFETNRPYSDLMATKIGELKLNRITDDQRTEDIIDKLNNPQDLKAMCLMCLESKDSMHDHPYFDGCLCNECGDLFKPRMFVIGNDDKCFYCTICSGLGTVIVCGNNDCSRVYCTACLKHLICPIKFHDILLEDPWECFLCKDVPDSYTGGFIKPRINWKELSISMFSTKPRAPIYVPNTSKEKKIRVLSLFDGLSTGLLVLNKLRISIGAYYASEIDEDALTISRSHFGDEIQNLGDIRNIGEGKIKEIGPIDLLIGGSPCNDLSSANPGRLGLDDVNGSGVLFFEYCRIKELVTKNNKDIHLFWLFENVASMPSKYRLQINRKLGQEPYIIDSAEYSPQHRRRLYWHNIPTEPYSYSQKEPQVQDVLTPNCDRHALVKKICTVTRQRNSLKQGNMKLKPILMGGVSDSLWITELEEIFGLPKHYTDVKNLCATKRQKLIGNCWSVQTLIAILQPLINFYQTNE